MKQQIKQITDLIDQLDREDYNELLAMLFRSEDEILAEVDFDKIERMYFQEHMCMVDVIRDIKYHYGATKEDVLEAVEEVYG